VLFLHVQTRGLCVKTNELHIILRIKLILLSIRLLGDKY